MKYLRPNSFLVAVIAGVVSAALYAGVIAFANEILEENWPITAWVGILIMTASTLGALVLQYETRSRLEAMQSKWSGLEGATGLCAYEEKMESSRLHPEEQLHEIGFSLDFMGNGGSKWTREEQEMRHMLKRLSNVNGQARMLLLHPASEVCIKASEIRFDSKLTIPMRTIRSLKVLDRLRDDFPGQIDFKLYQHTPYFRLSFVDRRSAIVGHYKNYQDESDYSPLMVWKADLSDWSFYIAFNKYFEAEWENGEGLTTTELEALEEQMKAYEL